MAEAKEEGPGPRGRVSGGRGGRGPGRDAAGEARGVPGAPSRTSCPAAGQQRCPSGPLSFLSPRAVPEHHRHERLGIT